MRKAVVSLFAFFAWQIHANASELNAHGPAPSWSTDVAAQLLLTKPLPGNEISQFQARANSLIEFGDFSIFVLLETEGSGTVTEIANIYQCNRGALCRRIALRAVLNDSIEWTIDKTKNLLNVRSKSGEMLMLLKVGK